MTNTEHPEPEIHNDGRDETAAPGQIDRAATWETGWRWGDPDPFPPLPRREADDTEDDDGE